MGERNHLGFFEVKAETETELYFELGRAHATDRALPLLIMRILTQGRGCELLQDSEEMLEIDLFFRKLKLDRGFEKSFEALKPKTKTNLKAYFDGLDSILSKKSPGS